MIPANAFGSHRMLAEFRETHTVRGYNGAGAGGRGVALARVVGTPRGHGRRGQAGRPQGDPAQRSRGRCAHADDPELESRLVFDCQRAGESQPVAAFFSVGTDILTRSRRIQSLRVHPEHWLKRQPNGIKLIYAASCHNHSRHRTRRFFA